MNPKLKKIEFMYVKLDTDIISILCCPLCKGPIEMINQKFICKNCATEYPSYSVKQGESEERIFDFRIHTPDYCLPGGLAKWSDMQKEHERDHFEQGKHDSLDKYLNEIDCVKEIYTEEFRIEGNVLDVGGAQGRLRHYLPKGNSSLYVSVDPFINVFQNLESQPNLLKAYPCLSDSCNFLSCYGENLPFVAGTFDWVHMRSVIDHFRDPHLALKEAYRVLKQGGMLLIGSTIYGGKSSLKIRDRDVVLRRLISKATWKFKNEGIKSLSIAVIKRMLNKGHRLSYHTFYWNYEDLIDLLHVAKFTVVKEHWQKPPFSMCIYLGAKKEEYHKNQGMGQEE